MPRILLSEFTIPDISAEVPFLFKNAGCTVDVYAAKGSWLLRNSSWDTWYEADTTTPERYAKGVAARAQEGNYDWVVFTEDRALRAVQEHLTGDAYTRALFPLVDLAHRDLLGSKAELSRLCERYGIPTPRFAIGNGDSASIEQAAVSLTYPLLVKLDRSSGGVGVFLCTNQAGLHERIALLTTHERENLVLQEFIQGDDISAEALFWQGELLAYASARVAEKVGDAFSVSTVRAYAPNETVEQQLQHAGKSFGLHGFCNATFRQEAGTGALYLIETDQRPNIWFALTRFAGVDFSVAIRDVFSGSHATVRQPEELGTVVIRHFHRDVTRALMNRDISTLAAWLFNSDGRWKYIPAYDSKLFLASIDHIFRTVGAAFLKKHPRVRGVREWVRQCGTPESILRKD